MIIAWSPIAIYHCLLDNKVSHPNEHHPNEQKDERGELFVDELRKISENQILKEIISSK